MRKIRTREGGYLDGRNIKNSEASPGRKWVGIIVALAFITLIWAFLNLKLLAGDAWISPTYDKDSWKTNEGDLHTFGAWDFETHVWKSQYIMENFPHFLWNAEWYLGMPLLKFYQSGFYWLNIGATLLTGLSLARSALLLIIFAHLAATYLTFFVCYKVSRKIAASAILSSFLLTVSFLSLRSYGWEPISVVFMFLYPLGLLIFLREPTRPFRFGLAMLMGLTYIAHPLIFFALAMTFGLYLFSLAIVKRDLEEKEHRPYILQYFALVLVGLLIGAVQFFPQLAYDQVTSGAHMGVSYIPFYHVQYNVLPILTFLFDAGNLKGPGFIMFVTFFLVGFFFVQDRELRKKNRTRYEEKKIAKGTLWGNDIVRGFLFVLFFMVIFYYLEKVNVFPMNILRSIQYHRIIPEFVIAASVLAAAMSNLLDTHKKKIYYYGIIIAFLLASMFIVWNVQSQWETTDDISDKPEFIYDDFEGRITFPYTDQSLAVRNSFTGVPQVYGYYEQGITNSYADELFSVSSGFHDLKSTVLYLKAANVGRVYINMEEGKRDAIMLQKLNGTYPFVYREGERYGYFIIPLVNSDIAQAVDSDEARDVQRYAPGCRVMFKEKYCGSNKEEFVSSDAAEMRYLEKYVALVEGNHSARVVVNRINPDHYKLEVLNADENTAVIIKMDHEKEFTAHIGDQEIEIEEIGPEFMIIYPRRRGSYTIDLAYGFGTVVKVGAIVSVLTLFALIVHSIFFSGKPKDRKYGGGDMHG